MLHGVLATCRSGFEKECAAELSACATLAGLTGYPQTKSDSGFCIFHLNEPAGERVFAQFDWKSLVFARSVFCLVQRALTVGEDDRITPILANISSWPRPLQKFSRFIVESADSEHGRELSVFCKSFSKPFSAALKKKALNAELWDEQFQAGPEDRCLHVFFSDYSTVYLGVSVLKNNSPWPRGIARLRFPSDAPSRSTLKLEEAFLSFMSEDERASSLSPARRAVDLGACPGGWTYQFVRRGIRTTAVDNGAMNEKLMDSGLVEHLRIDGFRFVPSKAVDWMVCDMVEQPKRVAELALRWWTEQSARRMIFNLKLPMKKRWNEIEDIRSLMTTELTKIGRPFRLQMKHLYHDREEVTVYLGPNG
jgi:23S rRNA (cytidine2498-2'-O)-methyltransferase